MAPTVALLSTGDPTSPATWSGTPFGMLSGLRASGATVIPVGPLRQPFGAALRVATGVRNRLAADRYEVHREAVLRRAYARQVEAVLRSHRPDLIVATTSIPVDGLRADCPVVIWADATVGGMIGYYAEFDCWSPRTRRVAVAAERAALERAELFVGASEWAVATARRDYGVPVSRLGVVPFGANLPAPDPPSPRTPGRDRVRLLAVGVDWDRKGIGTAVEAVELLRRAGVAASLDIVGCEPPTGAPLPAGVTVHGFVDPATGAGRQRLDALYRGADLFVLPTRAECFGVVFCEAAAYGLPVIAPDTGGIGTAVLDGVTGVLVRPGAGAAAYADAVCGLLDDPARYGWLSHLARDRYEQVLNWKSAATRLLTVAAERLAIPA